MPKSKAKVAALSNPTHKVVGPDGETQFFIIRQSRNTVRVRVLFDAPNWVDVTPAGTVSQAYGPSGADGVMMGSWVGPLAYQFTNGAIDALPDGAHCVEINPVPSDYDYRPQIVWSGWADSPSRYPETAFSRSNGCNGARLPIFRDETALARAKLLDHLDLLRAGTYRLRGEDYTPEVIAEFIADAEVALAYCDFLDSIPELPRRARKVALAA